MCEKFETLIKFVVQTLKKNEILIKFAIVNNNDERNFAYNFAISLLIVVFLLCHSQN